MRTLCHIQGRVQGVSYRAWTQKNALELELGGWVKNDPDGSVWALFEGPESDIKEMIKRCETGPQAAQVRSVQTHDGDKTEDPPEFPFAILF